MASRPRRSAAQRATAAITDMADRDSGLSTRSRRNAGSRDRSMDRPSSSASADSSHVHLTMKVPASKLRQATTRGGQISVNSRDQYVGDEFIVAGKRSTRGAKKRYVESESDEEEEEEAEADEEDEEDDDDEEEEEEEERDEIQVRGEVAADDDDDEEDEEMELGEEDADGEPDYDMDVDAEGEDEDPDADGDIDMDVVQPPPPPAIKVSKPPRGSGAGVAKPKTVTPQKPSAKATKVTPQKNAAHAADDDNDELSELDSDFDEGDETMLTVGGRAGDEDAEGEEEIEVAGEEEDGEDLGSDGELGSREGTPDLTKMTKRQRARFDDAPHEYMKLSDEVQVKKVFTAEELSMRRAEMARRRRNLSEKRNEEVKMETINKLLKKQEKKKDRKAGGNNDTPDEESQRANPVFIRWTSTKLGSHVSVPAEILEGPAGRLFVGNATGGMGGKMVQEVS